MMHSFVSLWGGLRAFVCAHSQAAFVSVCGRLSVRRCIGKRLWEFVRLCAFSFRQRWVSTVIVYYSFVLQVHDEKQHYQQRRPAAKRKPQTPIKTQHRPCCASKRLVQIVFWSTKQRYGDSNWRFWNVGTLECLFFFYKIVTFLSSCGICFNLKIRQHSQQFSELTFRAEDLKRNAFQFAQWIAGMCGPIEICEIFAINMPILSRQRRGWLANFIFLRNHCVCLFSNIFCDSFAKCSCLLFLVHEQFGNFCSVWMVPRGACFLFYPVDWHFRFDDRQHAHCEVSHKQFVSKVKFYNRKSSPILCAMGNVEGILVRVESHRFRGKTPMQKQIGSRDKQTKSFFVGFPRQNCANNWKSSAITISIKSKFRIACGASREI